VAEKNLEEKASVSVNNNDEVNDDRWLIAEALEGDKEAYGELVLKYQKRLFRFVYMMVGKMDTTEDVVQETFVKGYLALNTFHRQKPFYPWIATIARNLTLNLIKKEEREKPASEYEDLIASVPDTAHNPLDYLIDKESQKRFARAVMALPAQYRAVFVLRMFEILSYEEIARRLNISVGTVDSRLYRAREKLVEMLKDFL
jgi:RNA polymerase sigma-70 factor (ECF subfamily)